MLAPSRGAGDLRLDQHLLHVITAGHLVKTLPAPIVPDQADGAHTAQQPLPPPPAPPLGAIRKVPAVGNTMVARQRLRMGRAHAGKTVTIIIEDTVFRGPAQRHRAQRPSP